MATNICGYVSNSLIIQFIRELFYYVICINFYFCLVRDLDTCIEFKNVSQNSVIQA